MQIYKNRAGHCRRVTELYHSFYNQRAATVTSAVLVPINSKRDRRARSSTDPANSMQLFCS